MEFVLGKAPSSLRKVGLQISVGRHALGIRLEMLDSIFTYARVNGSLAKRSQNEISLSDAFVWDGKIVLFHNLIAIQDNIKIYITRPFLYSLSPTEAALYGF